MKPSEKKLKIAIMGSGAIAERSYLPVAKLIPNIEVTHVVDLDLERARDVANRFQIPCYVSDYHELFDEVDAAVVATPPASHSKITIDCLNHGLHVLCEKPLATSVEEAKEMIAASERTNTHLAVAMVRRMSWSSQLSKKLVEIGTLGEIHRFDVEEGWEFNWPLRTGHIFQDRKLGGVVADNAPHLFDLLLWILGSKRAQVLSCSDDNWGGVAANAIVELSIDLSCGQALGRIEHSFSRKLRNTFKIFGENGCIEASTGGAQEVCFYPRGENDRPVVLRPQKASPMKGNDRFMLLLFNFADSILNNSKKYVTAQEALATIALIEDCSRLRKLSAQPWDKKHLESFFGGNE